MATRALLSSSSRAVPRAGQVVSQFALVIRGRDRS
jgi:hypothetical protein